MLPGNCKAYLILTCACHSCFNSACTTCASTPSPPSSGSYSLCPCFSLSLPLLNNTCDLQAQHLQCRPTYLLYNCRIHGVITRVNTSSQKKAQSLIQERLSYYLYSLLSPGALLESPSNPLHTYGFIASQRVLHGVKRWDKDRVATPPLGYLAVLSMWLQNGNLEGLRAIAFQICWLLWGVAKEIHLQEKFWGVCLSVHTVY